VFAREVLENPPAIFLWTKDSAVCPLHLEAAAVRSLRPNNSEWIILQSACYHVQAAGTVCEAPELLPSTTVSCELVERPEDLLQVS
jgi:hypothetical protein